MDKARYIKIEAKVHHPEDSLLNGQPDTLFRMPLQEGSIERIWSPIIDLHTGKVLEWSKQSAEINYKVRDEGIYTYLDSEFNEISIHEGYVPEELQFKDTSGDYLEFSIKPNGGIAQFVKPLTAAINSFDTAVKEYEDSLEAKEAFDTPVRESKENMKHNIAVRIYYKYINGKSVTMEEFKFLTAWLG